jgi:hypothetical protein
MGKMLTLNLKAMPSSYTMTQLKSWVRRDAAITGLFTSVYPAGDW